MADESHLTALRQETIAIETTTALIRREAAEMDHERARLELAQAQRKAEHGLTDGEMTALAGLIIGDFAIMSAINHCSMQERQFAPMRFESEAYAVLDAELRRRGILPARG